MKNHWNALGLVLVFGLATPALSKDKAESLFQHYQKLKAPQELEQILPKGEAREKVQRIFTPQVTESHVLSLWNVAKRLF